jgi:hypothetical protein
VSKDVHIPVEQILERTKMFSSQRKGINPESLKRDLQDYVKDKKAEAEAANAIAAKAEEMLTSFSMFDDVDGPSNIESNDEE